MANSVKCTCENPDCKISIDFHIGPVDMIRFTSKTGEETTMMVDANTVVEMIKSLKEKLIDMTNG